MKEGISGLENIRTLIWDVKKEGKKGRGGGHGRENDKSRHHRARWAGQTGLGSAHRTCRGRLRPPISASVCVSLGLKNPGDFTVAEGHGYPLVIILAVHVRAMKKYLPKLEALRRKERGVNISVVRLFLFERACGPVLTF
jgi:hypothetical protein